MKQRILFLSITLLGQLLLAGFLGMTTPGISGVASSDPLFNFAIKDIDNITIEQPNKNPLIIVRRENKWLIPALSDFPALTVKVDGFIERVLGLKKRIPVATTADAIRRFKVSPESYEHKILLKNGEKLAATLWLGDSPGMRQIHGRANEDNAVYNLDFAAYEVNTDPNQWEDKTALTIKAEDITQINLPDTKLLRSEEIKDKEGKPVPGKWQMEGLAAGEELKSDEVDNLVNRMANLTFEAVLGKENQAQYHQETPALTISLTLKAGDSRIYVFSIPQKEETPPAIEPKPEKSENKELEKPKEYILKVSTSPYYFRLAEFAVKDLLETTRAKLIKQPENTPESKTYKSPDSGTTPQTNEALSPEKTQPLP